MKHEKKGIYLDQKGRNEVAGSLFGKCALMISTACLLGAGCYRSSQLGDHADGVSQVDLLDVESDDAVGADAACDGGLQNCHGECVDTMADHDHCGACDVACAPDETCSSGSCVLICEEPWHQCGDECVDLAGDEDNCGACGNECSVGHATGSCVAGVCAIDDCEEGWHDVNGDPYDGCEYECTATVSFEDPDDDTCENGEDDDCDGRVDYEDPDCTHTPPESCNGEDDDCDTLVDEDFDCVMSMPTTCTTACGSTGNGTCTETCELPPPTACTPPGEMCNGVDDDCDDVIDEGC